MVAAAASVSSLLFVTMFLRFEIGERSATLAIACLVLRVVFSPKRPITSSVSLTVTVNLNLQARSHQDVNI